MRYYCFSCVSFVVGRSVIVEKRSNTFAAADLYCRQHDIKEVSRGGTYHNGKFKALAEQVGLVCVRAGKYGWNTVGTGNDGLIEYTLSKDWSEIMLNRQTVGFRAGIPTAGGKSPSSTRKLICPGCRQSVRATKKVNILCGDCLLPMVEV